VYFSGVERDGKPFKLESGDWCAAAACWAAYVERRSTEDYIPHGWRASGIEIQQDAEKIGAWRPVADVRARKWTPARGDLAILERGEERSWQRHVARVVEIEGSTFRTIGANEDHAWRMTAHDLGEPNLLGFIDYTAPGPRLEGSFRGARVLLVGDSLAAGMASPLKRRLAEDGATLATVARGGTSIRQWARSGWLAEALAQARPALVLVSLGTNDMVAEGNRTEDIRAILDRVREVGAPVVWVEPPSMPTLRDRAGVRATLHATVPRASLFPSPSVPIQRAKDQIHATPQGYADLAAALWSWVKAQEV
jgi:lysophospholipase L1-like esterase